MVVFIQKRKNWHENIVRVLYLCTKMNALSLSIGMICRLSWLLFPSIINHVAVGLSETLKFAQRVGSNSCHKMCNFALFLGMCYYTSPYNCWWKLSVAWLMCLWAYQGLRLWVGLPNRLACLWKSFVNSSLICVDWDGWESDCGTVVYGPSPIACGDYLILPDSLCKYVRHFGQDVRSCIRVYILQDIVSQRWHT